MCNNKNEFKQFYPPKDKESLDVSGIKFNEGKLSWEVDFNFLEEIANRMELSTKYPPYNWQKPINKKELLTAGFRHYIEMMKGNFEDEGQDLGHLFAVVTNLMMYYYQVKNHKD